MVMNGNGWRLCPLGSALDVGFHQWAMVSTVG